MMFGVYFGYTMTLIYARTVIANNIRDSKVGITPGDIIKVLFSVLPAIYALGSIGPNMEIISEACIASSDYFTLLKRNPNIYISEKNIIIDKDVIQGKIEFKNVKFKYSSNNSANNNYVLNDLNLIFEPRKKIALVGESGCGKSTIVNLIERLYDPIEGQILFDGIDLKEYNLDYLRSLIGYVQQEPVLFNRTIKDNIIFGRENELKKFGDIDELLKEACKDAYINDFIENTQEKYDYIVGIKGGKLSGGQKQRIAIARAILSKPKLLINSR